MLQTASWRYDGAMKLPVLHGTIRRRILANWRVDATTAQALLPSPLRPKLQAGKAIAGVCLIRLENIRPELVKALPVGITSENAAHRIAVEWDEDGARREGVFIWRRDSDSFLNQLADGVVERRRAFGELRRIARRSGRVAVGADGSKRSGVRHDPLGLTARCTHRAGRERARRRTRFGEGHPAAQTVG